MGEIFGDMFTFLSILGDLLGIDSEPKNKYNKVTNNEAYYMEQSNKRHADKLVECQIRIENEKDPIKKRKMESRLNFGVTDFSDL